VASGPAADLQISSRLRFVVHRIQHGCHWSFQGCKCQSHPQTAFDFLFTRYEGRL